MNKAEEASQQPPSYTDATSTHQQGPYPPQQGSYPPQQGQYPPQQGQYPPQQGQYPPQQGQYPQPGPYGYQTQYHTQYGNVVVAQPMMNPQQQGPPPPDHMCAAIFVTLCCFWPTGVIAIIKASDAKNAVSRGDMMSAHNSARSAKQMITISVIVGIISLIFVAIIIGVYIGIFLNYPRY